MTARQLEQRDFHWPHGLYESAPFVYIAAGLSVNFQLDGPVAAIASAFLILVGLGILYLRWTYRRFDLTAFTDEAPARPEVASPATDVAMADEPFASSLGLVAAASHGDRALVDSLIREVLAKLEAHYRLQEEVLRESDPAAAGERWREHQALAAKIEALHRGYIAGKVTRQALIECIVYEALVDRKADAHGAFLAGSAANRRR